MLIEKDISLLLIVDVQEKLVSVMPKPHSFVENVVKLQRAARIFRIPIRYSEQYPKGLGKTIDSIRNNINKINLKDIIEKTEFAVPLNDRRLEIFLRDEGIHFIICGIEAHVCVLQTAINLSKNKKNTIYVVQDAVSSRYEKDYLTALSRLNKYSNIEIVSCEMVLFEWLRKSGTERFKAISQLIK